MEEKKGCKVLFNDGTTKTFYGWWTDIILEIETYCAEQGLETIAGQWF